MKVAGMFISALIIPLLTDIDSVIVNVMLFLCTPYRHTGGSRGLASTILNLGT